MNFLRYCCCLILLTCTTSLMFATFISQEKAMENAHKFYLSRQHSFLRAAPELIPVSLEQTTSRENIEESGSFYVFNIGENQGFILASADNILRPVLAYSDAGAFPSDDIPENLQDWLDYYRSEIQYFKQHNSLAQNHSYNTESYSDSAGYVEALLGSIRWDQAYPYNLYCPYSETYSTPTVTGCVATAMAQIMYYHQWPLSGQGSNSYDFSLDAENFSLSANFGLTSYDWSNMLNNYATEATEEQNQAVALLMYHCGVAVNMHYNVAEQGGSSAYLSDAGFALTNYFAYDKDLQQYNRDFYDYESWTGLLRSELDAGRPVLYRGGSAEENGHAFVCDGYDSYDFFHINWGWSGNGNGYFSISTLDPFYQGIGSSVQAYSYDQMMLTGIQKSDNIDSTNYQLNIWEKGLSIEISTLQNINSNKFDLSFGFCNDGLNTFSGIIGIGLYQNDQLIKTLRSAELNDLTFYHGYTSYPFNNLSLSGLESGEYKLIAIYQPNNSTQWYKIRGNNKLNNNLELKISGITAEFSIPDNSAHLVLNQAITTETALYQFRTGCFNLSINNSGKEFYSFVNLSIYDPENQDNYQYLDKALCLIPAGGSQTIQLKGKIELEPGNYQVVAHYNTANDLYTEEYGTLPQNNFDTLQISILPEPAAADLFLNQQLQFENTVLYAEGEQKLYAEITNKGGYFDDAVCAYFFAPDKDYSVASLNAQELYLDYNESKTIEITGSIYLEPGDYQLALFYYDESWTLMQPNSASIIDVHLNATSGLEDLERDKAIQLASNPVRNKLILLNTSQDIRVEILNLNGKLLGVYHEANIPVEHLPAGIYLLKTASSGETTILRFIKL